jgi:hypothetical protein
MFIFVSFTFMIYICYMHTDNKYKNKLCMHIYAYIDQVNFVNLQFSDFFLGRIKASQSRA